MLIVCIALRTAVLSVVKSTRGPGSGKPMNARVVGRRQTIDEPRRRPEQRRERSGRDEGLDQRPSGRDGR